MKMVKAIVDDELHLKFKIAVTKNGSNMQETIIKLIKKYIKEDK